MVVFHENRHFVSVTSSPLPARNGNVPIQWRESNVKKILHFVQRKGPSNGSCLRPDRGYYLPFGGEIYPCTDKLALNRVETALMLGISVKALDHLTSKNRIPSIKVGHQRIFSVEDILVWLRIIASCLRNAPPIPHYHSCFPQTVDYFQAAYMLSLKRRLFYRIKAAGQIPQIQTKREIFFRTSDLVKWLRKQPFPSGPG